MKFEARFIKEMLREIFIHESRRLWRDYTAGLVAVLIFAAALFGAYNGARYANQRVEANNLALAADVKTFSELQQEARDIESGIKPIPLFGGAVKSSSIGLFYPRTAALFPASMAFSSIGQADVYPSFFKVSGRRSDDFMDEQELENPTNLLVGRFDLAFVVVFLVPLFAFALAYNLLTAERENGTLALLLSQGVKLRSLLLGKTLARAVVLIAPLIIAALCAVLWFENSADWIFIALKFLAWCLLVVAYALVWLAVAALVNLYGKSSASNALTLAAVWIGLVMLAPTFINLAAQTVSPMPSRLELINFSRQVQEESRQPVELLENYYREHPEARPPNKDLTKYDFPFYYTAIQREQQRRVAPVLARYDDALAAQQNFMRVAAVVSPPLVAQETLNDLAGTGYARHRRFIEQVHQYHQAHKDFFEPLVFRDARLTAADYDRMPRFAFREESNAALFTRIFVAVLFLTFINALVAFLIRRRLPAYKLTSD